MKRLLLLICCLSMNQLVFAGTHVMEGSPFVSGQCVQAGSGDTLVTAGAACGGSAGGGIVSPGTFTWTNPFGVAVSTATVGTVILPSTAPVGLNQVAYWNNGVPSFGDAPGFAMPDATLFTTIVSSFNPVGGWFDDTTTVLGSSAAASFRMTGFRAEHVNLRNNSGAEIGTSGAPLRIDPTGSTAQPVTGTFWQATQPISGTVGVNNFPGTYTVTPGTGTWPITGTVTSTPGPIQIWSVSESTKTVGYSANSSSMPVNVLNTVPVTGTFWQTTQPVSITGSLPIISTNTLTVAGTVSSTQGTTPWVVQTTTVGVNSSTVAVVNATGGVLKVDGSAVTQPISGSVSVSNFPGTYTVTPGTGTFPVSGTVSATQGTSPWVTNQFGSYTVTPGTGTFPISVTGSIPIISTNTLTISGTVTANQGGTWTVQPGNTQNSTAWLVQASTVGVNSSTIAVVNAGNASLKVDGSAVTQPISGTVTANQGGTWNIGTVATITNPVNASITNTPPVNLVQIGTTAVVTGGLSGSIGVGGIIASSATNSGNPVKFGVVASTDTPTPTTHGRLMDVFGAKDGAIVADLDCPRDLLFRSTMTLTASTGETVFVSSGAAGIFNDALMIWALNTSATATRVDFRSGGNGSTIDFAFYLPAGDQRGYSSAHRWPQASPASFWTVQSSASVTDVRIYGLFCKSK